MARTGQRKSFGPGGTAESLVMAAFSAVPPALLIPLAWFAVSRPRQDGETGEDVGDDKKSRRGHQSGSL